MTGFAAVSLDGVDGLLAISWTVSKGGPCPLTPRVAARGALRSTLPGSSRGRVDLLCEVFGWVESCSVRRFPAQDGILDFSGLRTLAEESERGGEMTGVLLGFVGARWADGVEGAGRVDGGPLEELRVGLVRSWLLFRDWERTRFAGEETAGREVRIGEDSREETAELEAEASVKVGGLGASFGTWVID